MPNKFSSALRTAKRLVNQTAENSITSRVAVGTYDHGNFFHPPSRANRSSIQPFGNLARSERPFDDLPEPREDASRAERLGWPRPMSGRLPLRKRCFNA
jgi:hypothetical protein